jgi:hypothetical protein
VSHKANYWLASLDPLRVKSGAFRVLFHLCDHHRDDRDPTVACFPSQETLRERTGLSNGALNNALAEMESDGLLVRRRSTVPGSRERRTYYILGCDLGADTRLTPENGGSSNSSPPEPVGEQTPFSDVSNSILGPIKLQPAGEEPVRTGDNQEEPLLVSPSPKSRRKPEVPLPPDWVPSDRNIADAEERQFSAREIQDEADRFRNHHIARDSRFRDWDAAWRMWLSNARKFSPRGGMAGKAPPGRGGQGRSLASIVAERRVGAQGG